MKTDSNLSLATRKFRVLYSRPLERIQTTTDSKGRFLADPRLLDALGPIWINTFGGWHEDAQRWSAITPFPPPCYTSIAIRPLLSVRRMRPGRFRLESVRLVGGRFAMVPPTFL